MDRRDRVAVVTGASSGIGNACATLLAKKGWKVFGTCRAPGDYARKADEFFELVAMDIADDASVACAADQILRLAEGRIDALVLVAGVGLAGAIEDCSIAEARYVLEVNFLGLLRMIRAILPSMRAARSGRIVVIGAMAGITAVPFQGIYSASKFAVEGLIEALRQETRPFGIEATVLEPTAFRTHFGESRGKAAGSGGPSAYGRNFAAALEAQSNAEEAGSEPLLAAKVVLAALEGRSLSPRSSVGSLPMRLVGFLKRLLPASLYEKMVRSLNGLE